MGRGTPDLFPAVRSQPLSGFPPSVSCNGGTWSGQNLSSNPTSIPPSLLPWDLRPVFSRLSLFFWQMGLMSTPAPQGCGARTEERLDSLSALLPPTQPSPLGTVRHLGGPVGRAGRH